MERYSEEEDFMYKPQKLFISSFMTPNEKLITPLWLIYLELGLVCVKIDSSVEHTPKKCFNNFVKPGVYVRRQGDWNINSSIVAQTKKLLAKSFYVYQILDRSQHTITK